MGAESALEAYCSITRYAFSTAQRQSTDKFLNKMQGQFLEYFRREFFSVDFSPFQAHYRHFW